MKIRGPVKSSPSWENLQLSHMTPAGFRIIYHMPHPFSPKPINISLILS